MANVFLLWGDMDESSNDWYEDKFIPELKSRVATRSVHMEVIESPFKEVAGFALPLLTVYDIADPATFDPKEISAENLCKGVPEGAQFELRCYSEVKRFTGKGGKTGYNRVGCMTTSFWRPHDGMLDEIMKWLHEECFPEMMESPQFIAGRILKAEHVFTSAGASSEQMKDSEKYSHLTLLEWDADELPWEVLVPLGGTSEWRFYVEQNMDWQIAQYATVRVYPHEDDSDGSEKAEEE